jgi:DNA replication protein DnaC
MIEDTGFQVNLFAQIRSVTEQELKQAMVIAQNKGIALSKSTQVARCQLGLLALGERARLEALTPKEEAKPQNTLCYTEKDAIEAMNPGVRYNNAYFSSEETYNTECLQLVKTLKENRSKSNVLLLGGAGCGKTYAALAYVASRARKINTQRGDSVWDCVFFPAYELNALLGVGKEKEDGRERIKNAEWLIIDDLRAEESGNVSQALKDFMDSLLTARHNRYKPTIITCNAKLEAIKDTYSARFYDRLRDSAVVFESSQPSFRQAKQKQGA